MNKTKARILSLVLITLGALLLGYGLGMKNATWVNATRAREIVKSFIEAKVVRVNATSDRDEEENQALFLKRLTSSHKTYCLSSTSGFYIISLAILACGVIFHFYQFIPKSTQIKSFRLYEEPPQKEE